MIKFVEEDSLREKGLPVSAWRAVNGSQTDIESTYAWLREARRDINDRIDKSGGLLIRGLANVILPEQFEACLKIIGGDLMSYIGGTTPRKVVYGKIVTSTEISASSSIPMHQEMSYTRNPPDRIAFFCLNPASAGGESLLGNMRHITAQISPETVDKFNKRGVRLGRTLVSEKQLQLKPGIKKSWAEVFGTADKQLIEETIHDRGWEGVWLSDDSLRLLQEVHPATKANTATGDIVWHNQAHIFTPESLLEWSKADGRLQDFETIQAAVIDNPDLLDNYYYGDGEKIDGSESRSVFEIFRKNEIPVLLERNDILLLNNTLICHGRNTFRGDRLILTGLIS